MDHAGVGGIPGDELQKVPPEAAAKLRSKAAAEHPAPRILFGPAPAKAQAETRRVRNFLNGYGIGRGKGVHREKEDRCLGCSDRKGMSIVICKSVRGCHSLCRVDKPGPEEGPALGDGYTTDETVAIKGVCDPVAAP